MLSNSFKKEFIPQLLPIVTDIVDLLKYMLSVKIVCSKSTLPCAQHRNIDWKLCTPAHRKHVRCVQQIRPKIAQQVTDCNIMYGMQTGSQAYLSYTYSPLYVYFYWGLCKIQHCSKWYGSILSYTDLYKSIFIEDWVSYRAIPCKNGHFFILFCQSVQST